MDLSDHANTFGAEINVQTGNGDDTWELTVDGDNLGTNADEVTVDLGTGTDTLDLSGNANSSITSDITWSVSGVDVIAFGSAFNSNASHVTLARELLDGVTLEITGDGDAADMVLVEQLSAKNLDASNININQSLTKGLKGLQITGTDSKVETIVGSNGADVIDGNSGADSLSGHDGNDTFNFADDDELNADTLVDGGEGTDIVHIAGDGKTIIDTDLDKLVNVETLEMSDGANSVTFGAEADEAASLRSLAVQMLIPLI